MNININTRNSNSYVILISGVVKYFYKYKDLTLFIESSKQKLSEFNMNNEFIS